MPQSSRSFVRAQLGRLLRTGTDLDRLLVDYFPEVMQRTGPNMDGLSKINLLLQLNPPQSVVAALAGMFPEEAASLFEGLPSDSEETIQAGNKAIKPPVPSSPSKDSTRLRRTTSWLAALAIPLLLSAGIYLWQSRRPVTIGSPEHVVSQRTAETAMLPPSKAPTPKEDRTVEREAVAPKPAPRPRSPAPQRPASVSRATDGSLPAKEQRPADKSVGSLLPEICAPSQLHYPELAEHGLGSCLERPSMTPDPGCNCPHLEVGWRCDLKGFGDVLADTGIASNASGLRARFRELGLAMCREPSHQACELAAPQKISRPCFCCPR